MGHTLQVVRRVLIGRSLHDLNTYQTEPQHMHGGADRHIVLLLASGALAVEYHFVEGSFSAR